MTETRPAAAVTRLVAGAELPIPGRWQIDPGHTQVAFIGRHFMLTKVLHLWLEGYRQIPTDGPLFLLDAVAGFALAALLLVWATPLAGLAAAGYTASTLGALLSSLTVGLFGFRESISASYVTQSLAIETITVLALLSWTVLVTATPQRNGLAAHHRSPAPQMSRGR